MHPWLPSPHHRHHLPVFYSVVPGPAAFRFGISGYLPGWAYDDALHFTSFGASVFWGGNVSCHPWKMVSSRELTYTTWGKGKSSSVPSRWELELDRLCVFLFLVEFSGLVKSRFFCVGAERDGRNSVYSIGVNIDLHMVCNLLGPVIVNI